MARMNIMKQKELTEFLNRDNKLENDINEKVGKGLKLSDLSVGPEPAAKIQSFKRNKAAARAKVAKEISYEPTESKIDQTQSILIDLLNRDKNKDISQRKFENSNLLEIENSHRHLMDDERDLNNNQLHIGIQESPLAKFMPDDEISIISSRIETNRKGFNNTTFEFLNSTRKNKLKDESLRIVESIKKNKTPRIKFLSQKKKTEFDCQEPIFENEEEEEHKAQKASKRLSSEQGLNSYKSVGALKKSTSERKLKLSGAWKDNMDAIMKTHRSTAQKELMPNDQNGTVKRRPASAGQNNKIGPIDIKIVKASLKLLKTSMHKSDKSSCSVQNSLNEDMTYKSSRGPIIPPKKLPSMSETSQFKRKSHHSMNQSENSELKNNENQSVHLSKMHSPAGSKRTVTQSPNIPKVKRGFASEKLMKHHQKRMETLDHSVGSARVRPSHRLEAENSVMNDSIFDRSTFEKFENSYCRDIYMKNIHKLKQSKKKIDTNAESQKKSIERKLKLEKITPVAYDNQLAKVEKWRQIKKKEIKEKKKSFIQTLGLLDEFKFDINDINKKLVTNDDSNILDANKSSAVVDDSLDSINVTKLDMSRIKNDNHVTPVRGMNTSNILKPSDMLSNSHLSIANSGMKTVSKTGKKVHKGHESNISIDSSR